MQAMFRMMRNAFLGVNIGLYLFFAAIVIAFSLAPVKQVSLCGSRVVPIAITGTDVREAVSIAYSVIISFLSLVIGVLFLIFGIKTYRALNLSVSSNNSNSRRHVLFELTLIDMIRSSSEMPLPVLPDSFSIVSSS